MLYPPARLHRMDTVPYRPARLHRIDTVQAYVDCRAGRKEGFSNDGKRDSTTMEGRDLTTTEEIGFNNDGRRDLTTI